MPVTGIFWETLVCISVVALGNAVVGVDVDPGCQKLLKDSKISHLVSPKTYTFQDEGAEYEYQLGVCSNVVEGSKTAVTQRELTHELKRTTAVGRLNGTHLVQRRDYVELTYYFGDTYHTHCSNTHRTARIMFVCDPCGGRGSPRVVEEYTTDSKASGNSHCFYLFEWATSDVCSAAPGRFIVCKPSGLGPGSIFLIVLLSVGAAYLLLGFLYKRFIARAKGAEQCPNYFFWSTCGDHVADGCDFICRSKPRAVQMKPIPSVGRGDHQLDISEDDFD